VKWETLDELTSEDIIDSRDLIELQEEIVSILDDNEAIVSGEYDTDELNTMLSAIEDCATVSSDWRYGAVFIRDSFFETYAQELAADISGWERDLEWPLSYIDWEAAADALKMDYSAVEIGGVTYWSR